MAMLEDTGKIWVSRRGLVSDDPSMYWGRRPMGKNHEVKNMEINHVKNMGV